MNLERCPRCHRSFPPGAHVHGTRHSNADVIAFWRARHTAGATDEQIARQLGLGITSLRAHLNRAGIYRRGPYKRKPNDDG